MWDFWQYSTLNKSENLDCWEILFEDRAKTFLVYFLTFVHICCELFQG